MASVLRYLTSFFEDDGAAEPGLFQKADGTVWVRLPGGSEAQVTGGGGGGAPAGANGQIQFNDHGAFGASPDLVWDGDLKLGAAPNGTVTIVGGAAGVQLFLRGADGDSGAHPDGGEMSVLGGQGIGGDGGDVFVQGGGALGDGTGGDVLVASGGSEGGDGGDVAVRANPLAAVPGRGGDVNVGAGGGDTHGGNVVIQAGPSSGGPDGNVQLYSGDGTQAVQLDSGGLSVPTIKSAVKIDAAAIVTSALVDVEDSSLDTWEILLGKVDQGGGRVDAQMYMCGEGSSGRAFVTLQDGVVGPGGSATHLGSDRIEVNSGSTTPSDTLLGVSGGVSGQVITVFTDGFAVEAPTTLYDSLLIWDVGNLNTPLFQVRDNNNRQMFVVQGGGLGGGNDMYSHDSSVAVLDLHSVATADDGSPIFRVKNDLDGTPDVIFEIDSNGHSRFYSQDPFANALQLLGFAGQVVPILEVRDTGGNRLFQVTPDGNVHIKTGGTVIADL